MQINTLICFLACTAAVTGSKVPYPNEKHHHEYDKCLPQSRLEEVQTIYVDTYSGISDGGKAARTAFEDDFKTYSQSLWWVVGKPDVVAASAKEDNYPPIWNNLQEIIDAESNTKYNPDAFIVGPVAYGCNFFTFYWKGDFSIPGLPTKGRVNGIDIVYVNHDSGKAYLAYSEYNTLNQVYGWGAHITWSTNPTCCECPVPFNSSCICPAAC